MLRYFVSGLLHLVGKFLNEVVAFHHAEHIHSGIACAAEHLDDLALGVVPPLRPLRYLCDDLHARLCLVERFRGNENVLSDFLVVRRHESE